MVSWLPLFLVEHLKNGCFIDVVIADQLQYKIVIIVYMGIPELIHCHWTV